MVSLDVLAPETDFPSPDGKHPLKMALAVVGEASGSTLQPKNRMATTSKAADDRDKAPPRLQH